MIGKKSMQTRLNVVTFLYDYEEWCLTFEKSKDECSNPVLTHF